MADQGDSLIPEDADDDARVQAAVDSALADDDPAAAEVEDDVLPFGTTWEFEWETPGSCHDVGADACKVTGFECLAQWCLMAVHSTRGKHAVFSEAFGIESLDDLIGSVNTPELLEEYEARLREALLVHDRIVALEDFTATFDATSSVLYIETFTVVTDEEDRVSVSGTAVNVGEAP